MLNLLWFDYGQSCLNFFLINCAGFLVSERRKSDYFSKNSLQSNYGDSLSVSGRRKAGFFSMNSIFSGYREGFVLRFVSVKGRRRVTRRRLLDEFYKLSEREEEEADFLMNSIHSAIASGVHVFVVQ